MASAVNIPAESESSQVRGEDFYAVLWKRIRQLAPTAALLRGPAHLKPVQASGGGDLDILVPLNFEAVREFLVERGFHRVCKPQPYLERYRLRVRETLKAYTIDLYKAELWGGGFRLARNGRVPADPRLASLLHAVIDGKGTKYFEKEQGGPPWRFNTQAKQLFGPLGKMLWREGHTRLLTLHFLIKGLIRPQLGMILKSLWRRAALRGLQLTRKTGVEVALLGVDGTGKSSVSKALLSLPAPVKLVYMGPHDYQTWIMKYVLRRTMPLLIRQLAYRYDLMVRRLHGSFLARRGWIVVYDRHPAERLDPRGNSVIRKVKNAVDRLYAWPVDLTFWLTGNYQVLYERKKEYAAIELQEIDQRFQRVLRSYRIPFERVDVTRNDLKQVTARVCERVLAKYQERISIESLPGILRMTLV